MDEIDPLVKALIALCEKEGGHKAVADKAIVSAENLEQIIKGVKLPSGNPRGVGIQLRGKLTKAYPEWLAVAVATPASTAPNVVTIERRQCTPTEVFDNLEVMLMRLDDGLRDGVAGALAGMAKDPSKPGNRAMLEAAFAPQAFAEEKRSRK